MSKPLNKDTNGKETAQMVRLKVEGARCAVNTIQEHRTAKGISLICPFPALEVDVPVSYSGADEIEVRRGAIHRIGVEDDPRTGLPRLRLSIRTANERSTSSYSSIPSAQSDSRDSIPPESDERAVTDLNLLAEGWIDSSSGQLLNDAGHIGGITREDGFGMDELMLENDSGDPAWVANQELPMPSEISGRAKSSLRFKAAKAALWLFVIGLTAAGGFALHKSGLVDVDNIRSYIAGFNLDSHVGAVKNEELKKDPAPRKSSVKKSPLIESETAAVGEKIADRPDRIATEPSVEPSAEPPVELPKPGPEVVLAGTDKEEAIGQGDDSKKEEPEDAEAVGIDPNEVTVLLPTRWGTEFATAYRMRNPNAVVVDVPGGLVRREGWLKPEVNHPMVDSVKMIQRETGARFVVYVNGELPRFMTDPRNVGVSLRLYRLPDESAKTQQVALL